MACRGAAGGGLIAHDKGYYHSYLEEALVTTTPDHFPKPWFPSPKHPPGRQPCPPSCDAKASCSTPRSRCKAAATPSLEGKTPEISVPQASQIPGRGDLQQALADYLEAAGLQEAPNDTPLSHTAISKISQLTHNALHANDISHMMKRRLKDGSLPRRVRPTPSAPPSSPTCSARACRSQATPTRAPPGSITGGTRRSRATSWNGFRSERKQP